MPEQTECALMGDGVHSDKSRPDCEVQDGVGCRQAPLRVGGTWECCCWLGAFSHQSSPETALGCRGHAITGPSASSHFFVGVKGSNPDNSRGPSQCPSSPPPPPGVGGGGGEDQLEAFVETAAQFKFFPSFLTLSPGVLFPKAPPMSFLHANLRLSLLPREPTCT